MENGSRRNRATGECVIVKAQKRRQMSKAAARKGKISKKSSAKSGRISLSIRRPRSMGEDRLDGEAALKALRKSAERIPYEKARRDPGL
jgi:thymidine phosphorylase